MNNNKIKKLSKKISANQFFINVLNIMFYPLKLLCLGLIYLYKILISPILPKSCKFTPTCSSYAIRAFKDFGFIRGFLLTFKRILKCNPWAKGGYDPVPINLKGENKWLF